MMKRMAPMRAAWIGACLTSFVTSAWGAGYGETEPRGSGSSSAASTDAETGLRRRLIVSAENLFGYSSTTTSTTYEGYEARELGYDIDYDVDTYDHEVTHSSLSFLGGGQPAWYTPPGLALDWVTSGKLTLGASLSIWSASAEAGEDGDEVAASSQFNMHPRLGYLFGESDILFWPKVGFAYVSREDGISDSDSGAEPTSTTASALSLSGTLMVFKADSYGFSLTPAFYLGLSGEQKQGEAKIETNVNAVAINFGIHIMP